MQPDFEALCACVKPNQVHILLDMSGISYDEAVTDLVHGHYGGTPVRYIGLEALLKNKRAAARPKDLADVDALERARRQRPAKGEPGP